MAHVEISAIRKSFDLTDVLKGVDLSIRHGEFISLVGPSGCGKSTLLRIIAGLESQSSGDVTIDGGNVNAMRPSERDLAMVFQSYALYPHLSVFDNIAVPLRMRRLTSLQRLPGMRWVLPDARRKEREISRHVQEAADLLGMGQLLHRKPAQLSGGQRQRVAVGRAIVREPKAFLLDEPLSNLDAKLRVHMRTEIAQLHRRLGATFIYVTHDQAEAMTMSDRIAVMMEGRLIQVGAPDEVYDDPHDIRVAEFIGSPKINILPGEAGAHGEALALGRPTGALVQAEPGAKLQIGVRPEAMRLGDDGALTGRIAHIENLGCEVFLHLAVEGASAPVLARLEPEAARGHRIGDLVRFGFPPAALRVFCADGRRIRAQQQMRSAQHG